MVPGCVRWFLQSDDDGLLDRTRGRIGIQDATPRVASERPERKRRGRAKVWQAQTPSASEGEGEGHRLNLDVKPFPEGSPPGPRHRSLRIAHHQSIRAARESIE